MQSLHLWIASSAHRYSPGIYRWTPMYKNSITMIKNAFLMSLGGLPLPIDALPASMDVLSMSKNSFSYVHRHSPICVRIFFLPWGFSLLHLQTLFPRATVMSHFIHSASWDGPLMQGGIVRKHQLTQHVWLPKPTGGRGHSKISLFQLFLSCNSALIFWKVLSIV